MRKIRALIVAALGFSRQEANGMIILLPLIGLLLFSGSIYRRFSMSAYDPAHDQRKLDSLLNALALPLPAPAKPFKFNPNTLPLDSLVLAGFDPSLAARIASYRQHGGTFRRREDLLKMYGMDSLLYHRIESFVNLPGVRQVSGPSQRGLASKKPSTQSPPFDLNIADSAALESVYGIGGVLARRIVQFRDKLGGFVSFEQLREVYHLDSLAIVQLRKRSFIAPNFQPKKIAVNLASVIELGRHPYIKFKLANALVTYRLQHGNFRHPEDLLQVALMKPENLQRLLPYLTLE